MKGNFEIICYMMPNEPGNLICGLPIGELYFHPYQPQITKWHFLTQFTQTEITKISSVKVETWVKLGSERRDVSKSCMGWAVCL